MRCPVPISVAFIAGAIFLHLDLDPFECTREFMRRKYVLLKDDFTDSNTVSKIGFSSANPHFAWII